MKGRYKKIISFFLFILLSLILGSYFTPQSSFLNRLQCKMLIKNLIIVNTKGALSDDITIELIPNKVIFKNNKKVNQIPRVYGGIDFLIYFKKELIGQAGIHNTNWWHTHEFLFDFEIDTTTTNFKFAVNDSDCRSVYFKQIKFDSINNVETEIFSDQNGLTGQINKIYYDKFRKIILDEIWVDGILETINLYKNGEWSKNYSTDKFNKELDYELQKVDSFFFEYKIHSSDSTIVERIKVK